MKPGGLNAILYSVFFSLVIVSFAGCSRPIGKCTYGDRPPQTGIVRVKSIEAISEDNKKFYRVRVEGFFNRDLIFEENEFNECFKAAGYKIGSEIEGSILTGGPCPPIYNLNICSGK